jgi:hypothetical protein
MVKIITMVNIIIMVNILNYFIIIKINGLSNDDLINVNNEYLVNHIIIKIIIDIIIINNVIDMIIIIDMIN